MLTNQEQLDLVKQIEELAFIVRNLCIIERERTPHDLNWKKADKILHAVEAIRKKVEERCVVPKRNEPNEAIKNK